MQPAVSQLLLQRNPWQYKVLEATSSKALIARNATVIQWCGWEHILKDPRVCQFSLSPLRDHYLAVDADDTSSFFNVGSPRLSCEVFSMRELNMASMCLTFIGVMLYYNARSVSMSTYFRLSSGTVLFVTGAAAVLAFIMMKNIPYRRSLAAFFAVSTSSLFAVMRWVYGTWLPNMHSVIYSKPFLIYLLVSGLVGLALTYWMDDTSNVKINTTIKVGLNLLGLLLVYFGISDERCAVGAVLLLVAGPVMLKITRALGSAVWWVCGTVFVALRYLTARSKAASRTAGHKAACNKTGLAGSKAAAALLEDEPLLSDEEPEGRAYKSTGRRPPRRQPEPVLLPPDGRHQLTKLPSLDSWAQPQHPLPEPSPLHLRTPPPDSRYLRQPHQMVQQRKNVQQQMLPQNLRDRAVEPSPDAAYKFPTSRSPWSNEKVAVDVSARRPQSVSPPHLATAVSGRDAAAAGIGQSPADAAGSAVAADKGRAVLGVVLCSVILRLLVTRADKHLRPSAPAARTAPPADS
eukprot:gene13635-13759_t